MPNFLILRTLTSPYGDATKGSVLSQSELDDNFIFLKGNVIYTALTNNGLVTLKKYNGEDIVFSGGTSGNGIDVFVTGGTYSNGITTFTNNTGGTFTISIPSSYDAGPITGATNWSSTGTGQINLPQIDVALYDNGGNLNDTKIYTVNSGTTGYGSIPSLTDNDTNYIVIEYNGGSPIYNVYNNDGVVNDSDVILMYVVYRFGNFIHVLEFGDYGAGLANKLNDRIMMTDRFGWETGLMISLSGSTGVVALTSGVAWNGPYRQTLTAVNSQDDIFFKNYHIGGAWTADTSGDYLNNTYYDNGTDIVSATTGNYLINYYYRGQETNDHLYEVYGNGEYASVAEAEAANSPSLPELITSHAFLVGRIVVKVGETTGSTQTAFGTVFTATGSVPSSGNHNDLTGIQGGTGGEYYHLTFNEYNNNAYKNVDNNFASGQTINSYLKVGVSNFISTTSVGTILSSQSGYLVNSSYSSILAGLGNRIEGLGVNSLGSTTIVGGDSNTILDTTSDSDRSSIIGGVNNIINDSTSCSILSSSLSRITTTSTNSIIVGGLGNRLVDVDNTVILGGQNITGTTSNTVYIPNLEVRGQSNNPIYTGSTASASYTPNWDNSNLQSITLTGVTSVNDGTNIKNGAVYTLIVKQDATGSRTINWGTQYKWQSGIAPVLTSLSNGIDILTFISDGTNLYGLIAKDFR